MSNRVGLSATRLMFS